MAKQSETTTEQTTANPQPDVVLQADANTTPGVTEELAAAMKAAGVNVVVAEPLPFGKFSNCSPDKPKEVEKK